MARIIAIIRRDTLTGTIIDQRHDLSASSPSRVLPLSRSSPGLGDLVQRAADPIARGIDRLTSKLPWPRLRTKLAGCSACSRRRAWLNRLVPNLRLGPPAK